ncbi:MAG: hypothetical protein V2A66_02910, partial [Pseudomonadota bacterium]
LDRGLIEGRAGRGDGGSGRSDLLLRGLHPQQIALRLRQHRLPFGEPRLAGADRLRPASLACEIVSLTAPLVVPEGRVIPETDGVQLLLRNGSLPEEVLVPGQVLLRVLRDECGALHPLLRPFDILRSAAGPELVQLRSEGTDARLGPGRFGGEALFIDLEQGFRLFLAFQGSVEVGLGLFDSGAEFGRIQFGEQLILRGGLSLAHCHPDDTAAGLEGEMGLGGLDGSGVEKLPLPDLLLAAVDEEPHPEKEDYNNGDGSFLQGTPP